MPHTELESLIVRDLLEILGLVIADRPDQLNDPLPVCKLVL